MTRKTDPEFFTNKAHMTRELKYLLLDHFQFRAHINFKNKKKFSPYGNEHQCTYNQLLAGRMPNILLDREKGYTDLIRLIENSYRGKYNTAAIYMRHPATNEFDILCRRYMNGEAEEINDPVIPDENKFLTLYYYIKEGRVIIDTVDPSTLDFTIKL